MSTAPLAVGAGGALQQPRANRPTGVWLLLLSASVLRVEQARSHWRVLGSESAQGGGQPAVYSVAGSTHSRSGQNAWICRHGAIRGGLRIGCLENSCTCTRSRGNGTAGSQENRASMEPSPQRRGWLRIVLSVPVAATACAGSTAGKPTIVSVDGWGSCGRSRVTSWIQRP